MDNRPQGGIPNIGIHTTGFPSKSYSLCEKCIPQVENYVTRRPPEKQSYVERKGLGDIGQRNSEFPLHNPIQIL